MAVKFTQFLFPNRRPREQTIDVAGDVQLLADELAAAGWRFEIECHPERQQVHADCGNTDGPLAVLLCPNGPEVPPGIERMIREAHEVWTKGDKPHAESADGLALVNRCE